MRSVILIFAFYCLAATAQTPSDSINANPNPFSQRTLVSYTLVSNDTISIRVYNSNGIVQVILVNDSVLAAGVHQDSLRMDNFPDGIYIMSLFNRKKNLKNVKIVKSKNAGICSEQQNDLHFYVYPNPLTEKLWLQCSGIATKITSIEITNANGQSVCLKNNPDLNGEIDLTHLPNGAYQLLIRTSNGIMRQKLIKY